MIGSFVLMKWKEFLIRKSGLMELFFRTLVRWRLGRPRKALVSGTNVVVRSLNDYILNVCPRVSPLHQPVE
jgi:hypothetical protein